VTHKVGKIDLIGLALGDGGRVVLENGRRPPATIVESVLGVLDLLRVVVQLRGALCGSMPGTASTPTIADRTALL
jgi:hypothetical protein